MALPAYRRHAAHATTENWANAGHAASSVVTATEDSINGSETAAREEGSATPIPNDEALPIRRSGTPVRQQLSTDGKAYLKKRLMGRPSSCLYIALWTAVLTAFVVAVHRQRSRIEARIRRRNTDFLSNHNCPPAGSQQGTAPWFGTQGSTRRRLAEGAGAGSAGDVDPEAEMACVVAQALSHVAGHQTGQSVSQHMSERLAARGELLRCSVSKGRQVTGFSTLRAGVQWH